MKNHRNPHAVLFDLDGTLIDSIPFLIDCFRRTTRAMLGIDIDAGAVSPMVGMALRDMFHMVAPGITEERATECVQAYRQAYVPVAREHSPLFPGVREVLDELSARGARLAIVTGKSRRGAERILPEDVLERFGVVIGADFGGPGKPAPDSALAAARLLGIEVTAAVVVGDSHLDAAMARAAGMRMVGVATGTTAFDSLAVMCDTVVASLRDVPGALCRLHASDCQDRSV